MIACIPGMMYKFVFENMTYVRPTTMAHPNYVVDKDIARLRGWKI